MNNNKWLFCSVLFLACLVGCGGGNNNTGVPNFDSGPIPPTVSDVGPISIDANSTTPVINGSATHGTVYIHNNGETAVSNLTFGLKDIVNAQSTSLGNNTNLKSNSIEDDSGFVLLLTSSCNSIPAHSYCTLNFITPNLDVGSGGNSLITVRYQVNNQIFNISQLVNYEYVDTTSASGVSFVGSVTAIGQPNSTKYVVGYLLGYGSSGNVYNNVHLLASQAGLANPVNGFITGQQIAAGQVIPVEFAVNLSGASNSAVTITPSYTETSSRTQTNSLNGGFNISLIPNPSKAHFLFGNLANVDLTSTNQVKNNIVNDGTADSTTGVTITSSNNAVTITNPCSSTILKANAANNCTITYTINGNQPGTAQISYAVDGSTITSSTLAWTNSSLSPILTITPSANTISIGKGVATPVDFTVTNIGNAPLDAVSFTAASYLENLNTTCAIDPNNSGKYLLAAGQSCHVSANFISDTFGNGTVNLSASGTYNSNTYTFGSDAIDYSVLANPNLVFITPANNAQVSLNLVNAQATTAYTFAVQNSGNAPAILTGYGLQQATNNHPPSIDSSSPNTTCNPNSTLAVNESCSIVVTYGNLLDNNGAPIGDNETGSVNLIFNYHGGEPDSNRNTSTNILYSLNAHPIQLTVSSNLTGNGSINSPYLSYGSTDAVQSITLTYTNTATSDTVTNFSVSPSNFPLGLEVRQDSTCATTSNSEQSLNPGNSCTLVLTVNQAALDSLGGNITFNSPILYPSVAWTADGIPSTQTIYDINGNNGFYLDYQQASVVATLSNNNGTFTATTLNLTPTDYANYNNISVHIDSVNSWLSGTPVIESGSNCTLNNDSSIDCSVVSGGVAIPANISYSMPVANIENLSGVINLSINSARHVFLSPTSFSVNYIAPDATSYTYITTTDGDILRCAADKNNAWINCVDLGPIPVTPAITAGYGLANNGNYLYITTYSADAPLTRCTINANSSLSNCLSTSLPNINSAYSSSIAGIAIANINSVNYVYMADHDTRTLIRCTLGTDAVVTDCNYENTGNIWNHIMAVAYSNNHLYGIYDPSAAAIFVCLVDSTTGHTSGNNCTYYNVSGSLTGVAAVNDVLYTADIAASAVYNVVIGNGLPYYVWFGNNYVPFWSNDPLSTDGIAALTINGNSWFSISNSSTQGAIANNCPLASGACNIAQNTYYLPTLANVVALTVAPKP